MWPSSSAATKPLCDGTPWCSGTARIQASFELIAAMPSAQPCAEPLLIAASTTPRTRSAWFAAPLAAFHDWRNWPRIALMALKLPFEPPVPQKRPSVQQAAQVEHARRHRVPQAAARPGQRADALWNRIDPRQREHRGLERGVTRGGVLAREWLRGVAHRHDEDAERVRELLDRGGDRRRRAGAAGERDGPRHRRRRGATSSTGRSSSCGTWR